MVCPNCGNYTESGFCPNCGYDLRHIPAVHTRGRGTAEKKTQNTFYLGNDRIAQSQFEQIQRNIRTGEKQKAVQQMCRWTTLRLEDALMIADQFYTVDFSRPQTWIRERVQEPEEEAKCSQQEKMRSAAKAAGKGAGVAGFAAGYLGLRVIGGLVKGQTKKRR